MLFRAQSLSNFLPDQDVVNSPHTKSQMMTYFDSDDNSQKLTDEDQEEAQRLEGEFTSNISGQTDKGTILLDFPST